MKIINFCFGLRNKQIHYYLKELPEIYRTCEVPVLFINRNIIGYCVFLYYKWKYNLRDRSYSEFQNIGGSAFYTFSTHEPIFIYCAKGPYKKSKEFLVFTLFHELRHWYQQKHLKGYHKKHSLTYNNDINMENYEKQVLERDANNFARKYCLHLGIKFIKSKGVDYISTRSKLKI